MSNVMPSIPPNPFAGTLNAEPIAKSESHVLGKKMARSGVAGPSHVLQAFFREEKERP